MAGIRFKDPLAEMSQSELRRLRSEIDRLLPESSVKSMDLGDELVQQYHKTKNLMDETLSDAECPANQKSQVCNAVVTILGQLVASTGRPEASENTVNYGISSH